MFFWILLFRVFLETLERRHNWHDAESRKQKICIETFKVPSVGSSKDNSLFALKFKKQKIKLFKKFLSKKGGGVWDEFERVFV